MILHLEVDALPEHIILMRERFAITPYVDKPWQCYKCQGFGHSAGSCIRKQKWAIL